MVILFAALGEGLRPTTGSEMGALRDRTEVNIRQGGPSSKEPGRGGDPLGGLDQVRDPPGPRSKRVLST